jgi:hypothetical protein
MYWIWYFENREQTLPSALEVITKIDHIQGYKENLIKLLKTRMSIENN